MVADTMADYLDSITGGVYAFVAMQETVDTALKLPEDLAQHLGVSVATVQQYCREGRIQSVRVGKLIRIPPAEFRRVLQEGVPPRQVA